MCLMRSRFGLVVAAMGLLCVSTMSGAQQSSVQGQAKMTASPALSAALAQVPTGQAVAVFENDELTIVAQRAALIDVLREACSQIGAELDAPSEANEPVQGIFGPGPAREVLISLLNAFPYDLGTAGSSDNPNVLARIVVLRKSKTKDSASQESRTANALNEPAVQPQVDSSSTGEMANTQQMLELLNEAKANFVDNEVDPDDPSAGIAKVQSGDIFKALESIIKTAAAAEVSGGSPSTTAPNTGNAGPVGSIGPAPHVRRRR